MQRLEEESIPKSLNDRKDFLNVKDAISSIGKVVILYALWICQNA